MSKRNANFCWREERLTKRRRLPRRYNCFRVLALSARYGDFSFCIALTYSIASTLLGLSNIFDRVAKNRFWITDAVFNFSCDFSFISTLSKLSAKFLI